MHFDVVFVRKGDDFGRNYTIDYTNDISEM